MRSAGIAIVTSAAILVCGCVVAPLSVMEPLRVTVSDAMTDAPISNASVVYIVCDIHNFDCANAKLVRAVSAADGRVDIEGQRKWGVWIPAPGGLPVPNHFVAIWAPGYSAFLFSQYGDTLEDLKRKYKRSDILEALDLIPIDPSSSDPSFIPKRDLSGGKIRLMRAQG
jgi:hypothetical protein